MNNWRKEDIIIQNPDTLPKGKKVYRAFLVDEDGHTKTKPVAFADSLEEAVEIALAEAEYNPKEVKNYDVSSHADITKKPISYIPEPYKGILMFYGDYIKIHEELVNKDK